MVDDDLWAGRARHTWDTPDSVHGNRHGKCHCPATLINEFAGRAVCRQRSHGLTHHPGWSQPLKAAKIKKLRARDGAGGVRLSSTLSSLLSSACYSGPALLSVIVFCPSPAWKSTADTRKQTFCVGWIASRICFSRLSFVRLELGEIIGHVLDPADGHFLCPHIEQGQTVAGPDQASKL